MIDFLFGLLIGWCFGCLAFLVCLFCAVLKLGGDD